MTQPIGAIMQIAYVVSNLDEALNHWIQNTRAGPFFVMKNLEILDAKYRSDPTDVDLTIALGYSGSLCVELIQQNNAVPSVYNEPPIQGFHHWGIMTERFDQDLANYEEGGSARLFSGVVAVGGRFAYVDTRPRLGGMIELIELTPVVAELFDDLESAALGWDGSEPIRRS